MASEERKKDDLYIKSKRRGKNFFVTSSAAMDDNIKITKTTISSSVFTKMKKQFDDGEYLLDPGIREQNGAILYMLQEMQSDINDVYNEVSASAFEASYFPFATMDTGSIGIISSSLIPDADDSYDLGSSGKEWNDLYVDGTAYIDTINFNGTAISSTAAELNYTDGVTSAIQTQLTAKMASGGGAFSGAVGNTIRTFTDRDPTPDVRTGNVFAAGNSRATSITNFDNGAAGQIITIFATTAHTTFVHNTKLMLLAGARNITLAANDTIQLLCTGKTWLEISRSDNT